jgi:SAM-dependent methyltransferase
MWRTPGGERQVAKVNAVMTDPWAVAFPSATFWEWRYRCNPSLGSGVGSRIAELDEKRSVIASVIDQIRPASVLDPGCGSGEAMRKLRMPVYVGLDPSPEATRLARSGRPDGRFLNRRLGDHRISADL